MEKKQYLDIFSKAFLMTWKNRFLWFFGFLILLGSFGSNFNFNVNDASVKTQSVSISIQNNAGLVAMLGFVFLILSIFLFLLKIVAYISIIKSVNDMNLYRQMSVADIMKESRRYLWRVLVLEVIIGATLIAILLILATPVAYLFALKAKALAVVALSLALIIVLPLLVLSFYLNKYASFYLILADGKIGLALESAYDVFAKNIKKSVFMGLFAVMTSLFSFAAVLLAALFLAVIFVPVGFLIYLIFAKAGVVVLFSMVGIFFVAACVVLFSWYVAFLQTAWLLFFRQIAMLKTSEKMNPEKVLTESKVPSPEAV